LEHLKKGRGRKREVPENSIRKEKERKAHPLNLSAFRH
jgi:hypothetical protein